MILNYCLSMCEGRSCVAAAWSLYVPSHPLQLPPCSLLLVFLPPHPPPPRLLLEAVGGHPSDQGSSSSAPTLSLSPYFLAATTGCGWPGPALACANHGARCLKSSPRPSPCLGASYEPPAPVSSTRTDLKEGDRRRRAGGCAEAEAASCKMRERTHSLRRFLSLLPATRLRESCVSM